MSIEEQVRVTGTDKAAQDINRVADATGRAGKETDEAGGKAKGAGRDFDGLGGSLDGAGKSFDGFTAGMAAGAFGFQALLELAGKFREELERIVELQRELADQSTGSLETVLPLAEQWGDVSQKGLELALRVSTDLRKSATMPSLGAAQALAQAGDITLPGGTDPTENAEAAARNLRIAGAVGGAMPTGSVDTYSMVLEMLKTANLTDPEQIMLELSRAFTIQKASLSDDLGAFLKGLNSPGAKAFFSGGGSVTEAALLLLQAREASSDDATAATNMDIALRAARGSSATTKFLAGQAKSLGFGDFDTLTDTQRMQLLQRVFVDAAAGGPAAESALLREGFEPGQFPILKSMFAKGARDTATGARQEAAQARAADIEKKIRDFADSQIGKERHLDADIEYSAAIAGIDIYSIAKLRELAEHRNKLRLARRDVTGGELFEASVTRPEALIEREAINILYERALQLQQKGVDATGALNVIGIAKRGGLNPFTVGVDDTMLDHANEAVNQAIKDAGARSLAGGGGAPMTVNVTNVATNYADTKPGYNSPDSPDFGD